MVAFGVTLSSEEHPPLELVANARKAEEAGFDFVSISDHFHPWVTAQGHSPFVWGVLGAIATATERIEVAVVHEIWPNGGVAGQLSQDLPTFTHFDQAAEMVTEEDATASVPCGADVEPILDSVRSFLDAGYDHLYFHQIGPDQDRFLRFWTEELQPALQDVAGSG